jgi:hypothetical protein
MSRILIATATAATLLALPAAALANHGSGDGPVSSLTSVPTTPDNPRRDGKYLPRPTSAAQTPIQIVRVVKPAGFDFRDAGIGAALGALLVAGLCSVLILTIRNRDSGVAAGSGAL